MLLAQACPRLHTRQRLQNHISSSQDAPEKSTHLLADISAALTTQAKKERKEKKRNNLEVEQTKFWQISDDSHNR